MFLDNRCVLICLNDTCLCLYYLKKYEVEMGLLAFLKHWSNTRGQNITTLFSWNYFSSILLMQTAVILSSLKDTLLHASSNFLFQYTSFHFYNGLKNCMRVKWQMASQSYLCFCCVFHSPQNLLCFIRIFIFFAHRIQNNFFEPALPYYSNFNHLTVELPVCESESSCKITDLTRHVFSLVFRTVQC